MTDDIAPADEQDQTAADAEPRAEDDSPETLRAEIAQLREQMLRVAADAENAKRRAEREANDGRAYAIQKFAQEIGRAHV